MVWGRAKGLYKSSYFSVIHLYNPALDPTPDLSPQMGLNLNVWHGSMSKLLVWKPPVFDELPPPRFAPLQPSSPTGIDALLSEEHITTTLDEWCGKSWNKPYR